ncbi:MAG: adenylate/guanylate cyclase domain-containing protein [Candidatus Promineifilaceae bacterium]
MSDSSENQTQNELVKLRKLIDDLAQVIDNQRRAGVSGAGAYGVQGGDRQLQLLNQSRLSVEALTRGVKTQEKERQQLRALRDVGAVINSSLDQTEVLNTVMDTIIQLTGAERSFLMLYDEESGELEVEVARNINRETIGESSFEISRSIVGTVVETGVPVITTNAQEDSRFDRQESIISYNLRSILCVPLIIKENTIGVIFADNRIVSGIFAEGDRDMLSAFANQAAVAIENARMFRQIRRQLQDITEMKNLQDDVFESMASGVITIDRRDRISLYNRAAEQIFSVPEDEVIDQHYRTLLAPPMDSVVENVVEKIKNSGGHYNMELDTDLADRTSTATLNLSFSPLRNIRHETQGVALVLDDVSEKKRLESVRRYLPPALVDQVRDVDTAQQPQRRIISVLFADIRGFTTFSENIDPELLIKIVNGHLTVAAQAINQYEGLIDKYDGDAVMALFNTRLNPQEDHSERAVRAAITMRQELSAYHATVLPENCLFFRIGIHSGEAVIGNVGSPLRKDYSAIGDAVNVTKRLQELAGPGQILISYDSYKAVEDWVKGNERDPVHVKGRQAPVKIFEIEG